MNLRSPVTPVALSLLVLVTSASSLTMHYSQVGGTFLVTTAVVVQEVIKLVMCLVILWLTHEGKKDSYTQLILSRVGNVPDMLKVSVPGILYVAQNMIVFVAVKNLATPEYLVLMQLKTLPTALLLYFMLNKRISMTQCVALMILVAGCGLAVMPGSDAPTHQGDNKILGIGAVSLAICSSSFGGVYTEKLFKHTADSIWLRNIQLALIGIFFGIISCAVLDFDKIKKDGFFQGYTPTVWAVILLNSVGGLLVAVVMKFGDTILKCYATSTSIVLTCVMQKIIEPSIKITPYFTFGAAMVCSSAFIYGMFPAATPLHTTVTSSIIKGVESSGFRSCESCNESDVESALNKSSGDSASETSRATSVPSKPSSSSETSRASVRRSH